MSRHAGSSPFMSLPPEPGTPGVPAPGKRTWRRDLESLRGTWGHDYSITTRRTWRGREWTGISLDGRRARITARDPDDLKMAMCRDYVVTLGRERHAALTALAKVTALAEEAAS